MGSPIQYPGPLIIVVRARADQSAVICPQTIQLLVNCSRRGHTMRFANKLFVVAVVILLIAAVKAQAQTETSRAVEGGGISVPGWTGKIDANEEEDGQGL